MYTCHSPKDCFLQHLHIKIIIYKNIVNDSVAYLTKTNLINYNFHPIYTICTHHMNYYKLSHYTDETKQAYSSLLHSLSMTFA